MNPKSRTPAKLRQDTLYIYDTLELFGGLIPQFAQSWKSVVRPALGSLAEEVTRIGAASFANVDDMIRNAARIPQDRQLDPAAIQLTCQYAFEEIFAA